MYLKIGKKLYIHKGFFALPALILMSDKGMTYCYTFLFALLHECAHLTVARHMCGCSGRIFAAPYGFELKLHSATASNELLVIIAGPALSLFLAIFFKIINADFFFKINMLLFAVNIIPALPLDGGRLLNVLLWRSEGAFYGNKHLKAVSLAMSAMLVVFCVVLHSIWLLFVAAIIFTRVRRLNSTPFYKKRKSTVPVKTFYVSENTKISELMRLFSPYYYVCVFIGDSENAKTEAQIIEAAKNYGCDTYAKKI